MSTSVWQDALTTWRGPLVRVFFANFFSILLTAVAISEWGVLWWMFPESVGRLPPAAQLAGIAAIWVVNRRVAARTMRNRRARRSDGPVPRLYYAAAFTALFCFSFLLATGAVWAIAKVLVGAIAVEARPASSGVSISSSVDTGFQWFATLGVGVIGLAFLYGYTVGQLRVRVTHLRLALRNASPAFAGLRIAQISDLHVGQNLDQQQLERFVAQVNALHPDLVCITGDIADGPMSDLETFFPILAELRARHGVVAILGNHDHYAQADWVEQQLRALTPFTVLRDARTTLDLAGESLHIVGLDDRGRDWARGVMQVAYLETAAQALPANEPLLVLCHRPDVFPQAAALGASLVLSGHTHGGQIGIPWFNGRVRNLAEFITAFDRGLYEQDGSYLYVNAGLGVTGQRIRLCTPREITLIEVVSTETPASTECA